MPLARTQVQVGLAPTDLRVHEGAGDEVDWGFVFHGRINSSLRFNSNT